MALNRFPGPLAKSQRQQSEEDRNLIPTISNKNDLEAQLESVVRLVNKSSFVAGRSEGWLTDPPPDLAPGSRRDGDS